LAAALEQQLHAARWSIGVIGLIMDGTGPARVPDHIIDALRKREDKGVIELPGVVKHEQPEWEAIMTNQVMPKWKIDTIEAAIQALQRDKVPITASRIRKRTGPSVSLDEIRQHVAADRFTDRRK
jgi:hypothetical protein